MPPRHERRWAGWGAQLDRRTPLSCRHRPTPRAPEPCPRQSSLQWIAPAVPNRQSLAAYSERVRGGRHEPLTKHRKSCGRLLATAVLLLVELVFALRTVAPLRRNGERNPRMNSLAATSEGRLTTRPESPE